MMSIALEIGLFDVGGAWLEFSVALKIATECGVRAVRMRKKGNTESTTTELFHGTVDDTYCTRGERAQGSARERESIPLRCGDSSRNVSCKCYKFNSSLDGQQKQQQGHHPRH
jgi:hypothetical protein